MVAAAVVASPSAVDSTEDGNDDGNASNVEPKAVSKGRLMVASLKVASTEG